MEKDSNMINIMYQPRMDDPVCIARFETKEEAVAHMEKIKIERPRVAQYHYMEEQE